MKKLMSRAQFAVDQGVSRVMVGRWIQAGLPALSDGRIDAAAARRWLKENVQRRNAEHAGETFSDARRRRESATADLRELELGKRRGELVAIADAAAAWGQMIGAARAKLLGIGSAVGPDVAIETDVAQCEAIIQGAINEALLELSESDIRIGSSEPNEPKGK